MREFYFCGSFLIYAKFRRLPKGGIYFRESHIRPIIRGVNFMNFRKFGRLRKWGYNIAKSIYCRLAGGGLVFADFS